MILVFGSEGQVGRALTKAARARGLPLTALGRRDADITDATAVAAAIARVRPTVVVNAAAYTAVDKAEAEPALAHRVNATGAGIVAAAADAADAPVIHISTDYVFDGATTGSYTEEDPVGPVNVYGRSKEEGEQAVRAATPRHLILRTAWVFSAGGAGFVQQVLKRAREQEQLDVVADQWGTPTSADDLAQVILAVAEPVAAGEAPWGTYHAAGTGGASRHDFATAIVEAAAPFTGRRPSLNPVPAAAFPTPAPRPTRSVLDSSRFTMAFGHQLAPWSESVPRVVREIFEGPAT